MTGAGGQKPLAWRNMIGDLELCVVRCVHAYILLDSRQRAGGVGGVFHHNDNNFVHMNYWINLIDHYQIYNNDIFGIGNKFALNCHVMCSDNNT